MYMGRVNKLILLLSIFVIVFGCALILSACQGSDQSGQKGAQTAETEQQPQQPSVRRLVMASAGGTEGGHYILGGAWSSIIMRHVNQMEATIRTGTAVENLQKLSEGELDLAFSTCDRAYDAYNGSGVFQGHQIKDLRSLLSVFPGVIHLTTLEKTGINQLANFKGKRFGVGKPGSQSLLISKELLEISGIDEKDVKLLYLEFGEQTQALEDETMDVGCFPTVVPNGSLMSLATQKRTKLIPFSKEEVARFVERNPAFYETTIPEGSYPGVTSDVPTVAIMSVLYTTATGLSEEEAYQIVKTIWESRDEWVNAHAVAKTMTLDKALNGMTGPPLHPGAVKYYREKGIDIPENLLPPQ